MGTYIGRYEIPSYYKYRGREQDYKGSFVLTAPSAETAKERADDYMRFIRASYDKRDAVFVGLLHSHDTSPVGV